MLHFGGMWWTAITLALAVNPHLDEGRKLYEQLKYPEAEARLKVALQSPTNTPEEVVQISDLLARALIAQGFYVVLVPNGLPWGSARHAREVAGRLGPSEQEQVVVAPDPADGLAKIATLGTAIDDALVPIMAGLITATGWMAA